MDKKELIIIGIVIVIFIVVAGVMLSPSTGAKDTELKMLNNGTLGENGTIYIKLTDAQKQSLADKPVTVKITDKSGKKVLIAAHGNSLRALVKYLDNISDADIVELNIPTGVPLVYELDQNLKPIKHYYLGDQDAINAKINAVKNQDAVKKI